MATRVRRTVSEFAKHGMNYLFNRDRISPLEKERDREKTWLKEYIGDGKHDGAGIKDSKGNLNVYFDNPIPGPGNTTEYYGMQQRRVPGSEFFDTDEVKKFAETLHDNLYGRIVYDKTIEVVDIDELYVLHQEGKITARELRKLIHTKSDSYQLWPITEPPVESDDE